MKHLVLALSLLAGTAHAASEMRGYAEVVDGDGVRINGGPVMRLHGIDAPELEQSLGTWSRHQLEDAIRGREVVCAWAEVDRYGRPLVTCYPVNARGQTLKTSINSEMVRLGAAVAYTDFSDLYVGMEAVARRACRGVWQGLPSCFRKEQRR